MPAFSETRIQRAAKSHQCCECGERIEPGSRYERVCGLWDGEFTVFKTCLRCAEIRQRVRDLMPSDALADGYPYYGGLSEERDYYPEAWG